MSTNGPAKPTQVATLYLAQSHRVHTNPPMTLPSQPGETQQYQFTDHHWDQASCWEQPEDVYIESEFDPGPSNTEAMRWDWRSRKSISSDDTEGEMVPHKVRNISPQDNTDSKQLSEAEYRNRVLLSQTNNEEIKQEIKQEPGTYARPQQRIQYSQDPPQRLDNQRDAIYDNMLTPSQSFHNNRYAPNPNQLETQNPNYRHRRGGPREDIDWDHRPG